jgi:hypothetical protein
MKKLMLALALIGAFSFISCENKEAVQSDKLNIIFETDIGNDVDDAMALDMIYKYLDLLHIFHLLQKLHLLDILQHKYHKRYKNQ